MGIIVRAVFNNMHWDGKCIHADRDSRLFQCREKVIGTGYNVDGQGKCTAGCWESTLCSDYKWESTLGVFNFNRAKGNAYFVFTDTDKSLVLWGASKVRKADGNKLFFNKFKPFPIDKWVANFHPKLILGNDWKNGTYRYLDSAAEVKIAKIIAQKKDIFEDPVEADMTDIEGRKRLIKHLHRERSSKLVAAFKKTLKSYECRVCGFDFEKVYGEIGIGFIEAHHLKPVSALKKPERVSIKDLLAVCSNCHKMLHSQYPPIDWKILKKQFLKIAAR